MQGLFNEIFDLNHDGKLNDVERTVELGAFATIIDLDGNQYIVFKDSNGKVMKPVTFY